MTQEPKAESKIETDMRFIAAILREHVVIQGRRESFGLCEAWEVAKKYVKGTT